MFIGIGSLWAVTNCAMCHNKNYYPLDKYTSLQIEEMLHNYQHQNFGTMSRIAKTLNEKDIKEVAKKYSKK